jgi:putative flippase GtrA
MKINNTMAKMKITIFENSIMMMFFLSVGAMTAILNFLIFTLCLHYLHFDYHIAMTIAFVLGVIFYFFANRNITFKARGARINGQVVKFLFMLLISYLLNLSILHVLVSSFGLSPYLGLVLAIGIGALPNYLLGKFWVFRSVTQNLEGKA